MIQFLRNYTLEDYEEFLFKCDSLDGAIIITPGGYRIPFELCPTSPFEKTEVDTSCASILLAQAAVEAELAYESTLDSLRNAFINGYVSQCIGAEESYIVDEPSLEYHYTLYYYDQAGNLVKTVPPKWVSPLSIDSLSLVADHRENPISNPAIYPAHHNEEYTQYRYNSLNEILYEDSPDIEQKEYWYDRVGRVVASQDGRQRSISRYSYTRYDEQGRVIEVGETRPAYNLTESIAKNQSLFHTWVYSSAVGSATKTFYDSAPFSLSSFGAAGQENLRSRVASVIYQNNYNSDSTVYDYATHYSYDVTGNVKTVIQEIKELHDNGHGYKRIDYDYDLISGKVNAVYYQRDSTDQFTYRYFYDEDNRLQRVATSFVGTTPLDFMFEQDAAYDYYLHGPLARAELGDRKVQGLDYAYTLQGWIKGLNSSALVSSRDMGKDGTSTTLATTAHAKDAYGYTIGCFQRILTANPLEITLMMDQGT